jgi:hypothetical protein
VLDERLRLELLGGRNRWFGVLLTGVRSLLEVEDTSMGCSSRQWYPSNLVGSQVCVFCFLGAAFDKALWGLERCAILSLL